MPKTKVYTSGPQYIKEIWNGNMTVGTIRNSGVTASITGVNHDISKLGKGVGDVGGPMILHREAKTFEPGICFSGSGKGSQVAIQPSSFTGGASEPHNSDLYGFGGTAIARTIPTNPSVDLATELAESVGGGQMPKAVGASVWKDKILTMRKAGGEYLNFQFGLLPLWRDIVDVMHAVRNSADTLDKYHRGSGHHTRKGYHFPTEPVFSSPVKTGSSFYSVNSGNVSWKAGDIYYESSSQDRMWFSGCYFYHLPIPPDQMTRFQKYREYATQVLGLRPTLETVWNAAPWSWAVDWAADVGDVAHNISAFGHDGLLLHYGYIMCHRWKKEVWHSSPKANSNCSAARTEHLSEWKVRFPASPYGFGLTYDGLSATQKAILAAVGMSHQRFL